MAHNIANVFGRDMVFTGRGEAAWHKLGTVIQGVATWREAMELADLNWEVEKRVLFDRDAQEVPAWGIFRDKDNAFLGAVGEKYQTIQNHAAFEFVDALIGSQDAHYDSAGALGNGEVIFCSAYLPSAGYEVVPGDTHATYLLFKTSHDGSMSAICKLTDVRVVCENTLNMALRNGGNAEIKIKHTKNAIDRMAIAQKLVASGQKTAEQIRDKMRQLVDKRVTRESMEDILTRLFPTKDGEVHTRTRNSINDLLGLYDSNDRNTFPQIRGTAYNLLNATIEWVDKYRGSKGGGIYGAAAARAESAMFGSGEKFKSDAFEYIYEAANKMPDMKQPIMVSIPQNVAVKMLPNWEVEDSIITIN